MRVLAFHLPQFHPIPENDTWWGKGFTEWTNVTRARPLFEGHFQPRLPADLGFYDLRLPEALQAQADLARQYGIHGFCYHYYWFKGGRRLLERPLEQMLASGNPDFPFCLCWANENWTRRWDGQEKEVLMPQRHDEESDIAFLHSVLPYFRDPRYIRVGKRPLLVVYRGTLFPDLRATVARWHAEAARLGEAPPYLVAAESFDVTPELASAAGFDATCEFPPHGTGSCKIQQDKWPAFHRPFSGLVLDYGQVVTQSLGRTAGALRRFRTVTLNWDNTARKKSSAHMMQGFSLPAYHRWLSGAVAASRASDPEEEQFVFINAWNEWAEGTYLEPDHLYGHAYLEATRAAIDGQPYQAWPAATRVPEDSPRTTIDSPAPATVHEPAGQASVGSKGRLSVVGITMIGNEADIVEAFVRENCRLLDHLLIADHNSLDGTREILAELVREGLPISVQRIDDTAYAQTEVTNRLLDEALARFDPDWILPIDADEILDVPDRGALEAELAGLGGQHGCLAWITHVPTAGDNADEQNPLKRIVHRYLAEPPDPAENPFCWKVILNAALIGPYRDRYALEKGNHRVVFRGTQQIAGQPVKALRQARLRHYPVRSYSQLAAKVGIGLPQKSTASSKLEQVGVRWSLLLPALLAGRSDAALLQAASRSYLDSGRLTADSAILTDAPPEDIPVIADPLPNPCELQLSVLQLPLTTLFLRWIAAYTTQRPAPDPADRGNRGTTS